MPQQGKGNPTLAGFLPQIGKILLDFLIMMPMSMFDNAQNAPDFDCYRKYMDLEFQGVLAVYFWRIR